MKKFFFFLVFINICLNSQSNLQELDRGVYPQPRSLLNVKADTFFMPMYIGNSYQYIQSGYGGGVGSYYLKYGGVSMDTIINNQKYYLYNLDNSNNWLRYSELDNILYIYSNENDLVYMDFNLAPGDTFTHFNFSATVLGGTVSLFSMDLQYKGFIYSMGSGSTKTELFAQGLGLYKSHYNSQYPIAGHRTFSLIMAALYDSLGNSYLFSNHYKPEINATPITLIDSSNFKLNFTVNHEYNCSTPPGHVSMFFIDFVKLDSYYSKEDSIVEMPLINANGVINYSVTANLDTTLLKNGFTFNYRIMAKDKGLIPETSYSPDTGYYKCVWNGPTGIDDNTQSFTTFSLSQNYPNPFNPSTKISWQSPVGSHQTLKVYDVLGREVATLVDEYRDAGSYEVEFDGSQLASGVYYYQLKFGEYIETKKMILAK